MTEILGIQTQALFGQLMIGLINGSFYAILSLGLAVIFGLLGVANFAHGAQYMLGAFTAYLMYSYASIGYWPSMILAPLIVGVVAIVIERLMLRPLAGQNHLYGLLLTFGLALIIEGLFRYWFGSVGRPYAPPAALSGGLNLGFMYLPIYRGWVLVASLTVCLGTWLLVEKTRLGSYLRAATENATLVKAFGVNVPLLITLTYGFGASLAGLAGLLAAPIYQVSPLMGFNILIVVFAVVVVGGMGSILGSIVIGYVLGVLEGFTKVFYPEASNIVIFVIMVIVLLLRPAGLFGKEIETGTGGELGYLSAQIKTAIGLKPLDLTLGTMAIAALLAAPFVFYPGFLMSILCFALYACAFNLLIGYVGLLSFGHAAFFGGAAYVTAHAVKVWGMEPLTGILIGSLTAAALGVVFGFLAIRRQGLYFAMITLALAQMVFFVCLKAPFTHGEDGLQGVPNGRLIGLLDLSNPLVKYYFALAVFLFGFLVLWRIVHSPFGNILKGIRENENRMISLGYRVDRYKLAAFVMSAALAGFAGATKAVVFRFAVLNDVHWIMSGDAILMSLLGGIGTMLGPVMGAALVVSLQNYLATSHFPVTIITGSIFVLCVLLFRHGMVGFIKDHVKLWK